MLESIMCLAMAIYFEARGEPMVGQVAVAQVIMNRVYDHRYPNDVCDVVKQGYYYTWNENIPIRDKCQFSFWCDGKPEIINNTMHNLRSYARYENYKSGIGVYVSDSPSLTSFIEGNSFSRFDLRNQN